jgi:membrane-bound serine protease (ClpP class)
MRLLLVLAAALALTGSAAAASGKRVLAIRFGPDLEVNPVTQDYLTGKLDKAAKDGYDAAVILLDTPGGLSTSMKTIYTAELNAKLPVIVYVSPSGARAASAGVWIAQAADVLAMSPDSNIGSSSLTALAQTHHRNTTWPAKAVRVASNLTAQEALKLHVIDAIAPSLPALLRQLDGYRTKDAQRPYTLHLAGARIDQVGPGFFTRLLNTLIDPNILSLLFLAGIIGIGFEVFHPGIVLPGALGAVALVTALFGFSVLPISWAGLALILLGVALLVIDAHVVSHGALTVSGLIALAVGMLMLFHNAPAPYHTSVPLVITLTVAIGGFWAFALGKAVRARRQPVTVGPERVLGDEGVVRDPEHVFVDGELWRARRADGGELVPGERVRVEHVDGLQLTVTGE